MRYHILACDYDGTIATNGVVDDATRAALALLRASGRKLVLVTGREMEDLRRTCHGLEMFDCIVGENGGLLYWPQTKVERPLAAPPDAAFVQTLIAEKVSPLSVGRTIVATWDPHSETVLRTIQSLGLELQVIFNKGAVMILPSGVNKATGLLAALTEMGYSPKNCVAVGDAENDHAFFELCMASAAVANALPAVKVRADIVLARDHGAGVTDLVGMILKDELPASTAKPVRRPIMLGQSAGGATHSLPRLGGNILVLGAPATGKSALATALVEQMAAERYQFCLIDSEDRYESFAPVGPIGSTFQRRTTSDLEHLLDAPTQNAIVSLDDVPTAERLAASALIQVRLKHLQSTHGRPHWTILDAADQVLPPDTQPGPTEALIGGNILVATDPRKLHSELLRTMNLVVALGATATELLGQFAQQARLPAPPISPSGADAILWDRTSDPVPFTPLAPASLTGAK